MTSPNFSLPYPPVGNNNNNLQYLRFACSVAATGTQNVFTLAPSQGRFFCTKVVFHDPTAAMTTTTISLGSTGTSTFSISPVISMANFAAAGSYFATVDPGLIVNIVSGSINTASPPNGVPVALAPGDTITATVVANPVAGASVMIDLIGYYE